MSNALAAPVASGVRGDSQLIVIGGGQEMVGFSRSVTVMICTQLELLPHASVTFHVLRIVPVPLHPSGATSTSVRVRIRFPEGVQLSAMTGVPVTAGWIPSEQSSVIFCGQVIVGFTWSMIVMNCAHEVRLLHASSADHVLLITPVPLQASG